MATYKLIQDVEAEDHVLGPLSLRQFIFGMLAAFCGYLCYFVVAKGAPYMLIVFIPPTLLLGFFAFPFGRDQPTETWALAKLNFYFKPRKRIWNQSGVKELVTITAPKKVERVLTKGLSENEVRSRLKALADTIDSRGWAVKNINLNAYAMPLQTPSTSDRLIDMGSIPSSVPDTDIGADDDMLDLKNNPLAQQFDSMMDRQSQAYRAQVLDKMNNPVNQAAQANPTSNNYWFMNSATQQAIQPAPKPVSFSPSQEKSASQQLRAQSSATPAAFTNLRTLKKPSSKPQNTIEQNPTKTSVPPVTAPADPAILSLADNNDLSVATLAREANRTKNNDEPKDEVVVSLR